MAPVPSKSSSVHKHQGDSPLEPPCDSLSPLSPSLPSETTGAGAMREERGRMRGGEVESVVPLVCSTS